MSSRPQNSKVGLVFSGKSMSEVCHFCKQKVYLMEKISAENLVLHRSCLKCAHCHTNLRLGGYAFDRDSPNGFFYCTQHFRLPVKSVKTAHKQPRLMVRNIAEEDWGMRKKLLMWTREELHQCLNWLKEILLDIWMGRWE